MGFVNPFLFCSLPIDPEGGSVLKYVLVKKIIAIIKKEPMLLVSLLAALISLFITPPDAGLLKKIDWHTLGTLFMMLTVLEGFKQEKLFNPLIRLAANFRSMAGLSLFLIFGVLILSVEFR